MKKVRDELSRLEIRNPGRANLLPPHNLNPSTNRHRSGSFPRKQIGRWTSVCRRLPGEKGKQAGERRKVGVVQVQQVSILWSLDLR